jgi:tyrosyl-tRNA synthetase
VVQHLRWLTLMPASAINEIEEAHRAAPEKRPAQRALAFDLTARVHGKPEAQRQVRVAEAVFGGGPLAEPDVLEVLYGAVAHFEFDQGDLQSGALAMAVRSGLYPSNSEARRQIAQGAFSINDQRIIDGAPVPTPIGGRYLTLRAGRKRLIIGRRRD